MQIRSSALAVAAGVAVLAGASFQFFAEVESSAANPVGSQQGLIAIIDDTTGQLRAPTATEAQRYAPTKGASQATMSVVRRNDGSESLRLDDSYTIYSTVTRNADGTWQQKCSLEHDHAAHSTIAAVPAKAVK